MRAASLRPLAGGMRPAAAKGIFMDSKSSSNLNEKELQTLKNLECPDSTAWTMQPPLVLSKAKGSYLFDAENKSYIDMIAGFGSLPLGHASGPYKKVLEKALKEDKMVQGLGDLFPSTDKIAFLKLLIETLPAPYEQASLALSGSQAVEGALKTAMLYTGRSGFISFEKGYHGVDLGALMVTSNPYFKTRFKKILKEEASIKLPIGCAMEDFKKAARALQKNGHGLAGAILEPIQGRAGILPADEKWLMDLKEEIRKEGGLLILDEIFTGLGRTGQLLASPTGADILLLGKALGGGLPLSAFAASKKVMAAWPTCEGEALHTGTFFGHPLACQTGLETLKVLREEVFLSEVREKGIEALDILKASLRGNKAVKEVRGRGLFMGIAFVDAGYGVKACDVLRENGIVALPSGESGKVLSLTPALNIDRKLLGEVCRKIGLLLS